MTPHTDLGKVAIITGANSNLGICIGKRLMDSISPDTRLTIIVSSRTLPRAKEALKTLKEYALKRHLQRPALIEFDYILFDFNNMVSVTGASHELNKRYRHIDYFFANSAFGLFDGIDWVMAAKECSTNLMQAVTDPSYKKQIIGGTTRDGMGSVFQANVFGPWFMLNEIIPLMKNGGKFIWISSLLSDPTRVDFTDIELVKNSKSYEGSKRLIDLLHEATYQRLLNQHGIQSYLVHPGIFRSSSFAQFLNIFTYYGMIMMFYIARFLGSPWHVIDAYVAANAVIWAATKATPETVDQSYKYGSACDWSGKEYVKTEAFDSSKKEIVEEYVEKKRFEWKQKLKNQID
ncbi:NAD(P)-binding protein [Nadsonia fulvescens var. elongata DSM 6958]|uniref:3beta-hydroxysteroid 3-dehydrogenase n=1 Tax=Nadsonia fulvescens var. elongata DSM 6958 TaxID=857566 RepID=A0A1E3PNV7_9ASCO|nr:NAD(P)-binding protein [Nadsonia fulvescens var. elongata DSM 6958]